WGWSEGVHIKMGGTPYSSFWLEGEGILLKQIFKMAVIMVLVFIVACSDSNDANGTNDENGMENDTNDNQNSNDDQHINDDNDDDSNDRVDADFEALDA